MRTSNAESLEREESDQMDINYNDFHQSNYVWVWLHVRSDNSIMILTIIQANKYIIIKQ